MIDFGSASGMHWVGDGAIQHDLHDDGRPITCRISAEALRDHFGAPANTPEACLDAAQRGFDRITDQWGHLLALGQTDPDGGVTITTAHF